MSAERTPALRRKAFMPRGHPLWQLRIGSTG
jgi:hypothetical protein